MDKGDVSVATTMGVGTVQAFTTFIGSVNTSDMLDAADYSRGIAFSLGWSFIIATAVSAFSDSWAPFAAWVVTSGAMLGAYEYHRDRAYGNQA